MLAPFRLSAESLTFQGKAKVVDENIVEIWGQRIRLWGITALSISSNDRRDAKAQLRKLIAGVIVRCESVGVSSMRYTVARCYAGGVDIAWPLVMTGIARDNPEESGGYYASGKPSSADKR